MAKREPIAPTATAAAKGGRIRARNLSREERREIAIHAAEQRWGTSLPRATHAGILKIGNAEISCYVLENGERILSTRGVMKTLGRRWRGRKYAGTKLPVFLEAKNLTPFIGKELPPVLSVIEFRTDKGARGEGFKAEVLPMVCETYLKARDDHALTGPQQRVAIQCEILMRGLAHIGIIALVDEATGFQDDRARDALAKILEAFVAKELRKWIKTFPIDYFKEMCRLRSVEYSPDMKLPRYFGHLTNDAVYKRLAPGVLKELQRINPSREGRRKHTHTRWITEDIGHPRLLEHLSAVVALMRVSVDWERFVELLDMALPRYPQHATLFDEQTVPK